FVRAGKWYYAAKGGHNEEQHNHNDVGSLIVRHGTEPVLIDAGCGTYTRFTFSKERYTIWTMQSGWHNLPAVNGCDQLPGEAYRAGSFSVDGKKTEISFAGAYPAEAALESLVRRVCIGEEGVTVSDSFAFNAGENHVSEHFICLEKPEVTEGGVLLGGKYQLQANIPCDIAVDRVDFPDDRKLCGAWGTDHLWRVRMSFSCEDRTEFTLKIRRA
ncbi:MAG: heparinase II/III family protein, partial [Oscillospiraceae bacterium]|nr:heparinase II/III family protein [Oscillospiraceae bacterium]